MHARFQRSHAFTLVELLVVIAIIAVLASLMIAGLSGAKASAISANCKSNLRQVGHAMAMYTGDTGFFPANQYGFSCALDSAKLDGAALVRKYHALLFEPDPGRTQRAIFVRTVLS